MLNAIEINNLFFINIVRIIFIVGFVIEIALIVNYYRETGKKAKQKSENRDLSIFSKGNIRSPLHFVPTLLTAIGILGTFWGISQGLKGIDLANINNTDALLNSSTELLAGMKTAFQTSLWGLGGASLFIFILAGSETLKRVRRNHLIPKIRQNSDQNQTQDLINQLGNIADKMEGLATLNAKNIGEEVATALNPTFQDLRNDLKSQHQTLQQLTTLTPETIGEEVATALNPTFGEIKNDLNLQRQTIENQRQELLTTLIGELKNEVIEPVITRLDESAAMTKEASNAVKELKQELGGISESLATSIQTIQQFQEQTLGQLEAFAQNLQQILDQFKTDTQGVMEQMATDIHNAVNESILGMEAQRTAFAESAEQASTTFRGIREDLQAALTTQAQQQQTMLENVQSSTESILQEANNAFAEQSNTLTRVGTEASDMMSNASDNLNGTLTNIDSMLQNTRQTVQQELENFRLNYQESLNQFFEQQNSLLEETLGKQREGLEEVVRELQRVFQEDAKNMTEQVIESMNKIQTTTQAVSDLANTTGLTSAERLAQIQEIARTLGSESRNINQAYQNLIQNFNQGLETWNENLTQYFEQANETYQQGRQESEQAAAEVCNQLNQTSQGLMSVAYHLVAAADDLNNSNGNR
ncbi:MAG: hypothetical protein ACLFQP_03220 [Halothece sp.]